MNKIRIVVIDDEYLSRELLTMLIPKLNTDFEIVGNAHGIRSGLAEIERTQPDVVFLDVKMPDGSGFEIAEKVSKQIRLVFVTGFDTFSERAFQNNAAGYLLKPIDTEKLSELLADLSKQF